MSNVFRAAARILAALIKSTRSESVTYPTRRPVDEILNVGYKFAHGPHSIKDLAEPSKDAA